MKTVTEFYTKIDNFSITLNQTETMMKFICYNHEISYDNNIYRQIKGVPMGCRFSPTFAIIYLHHIETKALSKLSWKPELYKRYIDDVIIGPVEYDDHIISQIENEFNKVTPAIKFTTEINPPERGLNFLDLTIYTDKQTISFSWFQKTCHSGITMQSDSYVPEHIKNNFVQSRLKDIQSLCSTEEHYVKSRNKFLNQIEKNGHKKKTFRQPNNKKKKIDDKIQPNLILPFINNQCHRKLRKLMNKHKLRGNLVSQPNKTIASYLKPKNDNRNTCDCEICRKIGPKYMCTDKYVVYQYTCKTCRESYIGKTARPFKIRHREHTYAVRNKSLNNAISLHANLHQMYDIDNFDIEILSRKTNSRDITIEECRSIKLNKPKINRKQEVIDYPLISGTQTRVQF